MTTKLEQLEREHLDAREAWLSTHRELDAAREDLATLPGVRAQLATALQEATHNLQAAQAAARRNAGRENAQLYNSLLLGAEEAYQKAKDAFAPYTQVDAEALSKNVVVVEAALSQAETDERKAYSKVAAVREAETVTAAREALKAYHTFLDVLSVHGVALSRLDGREWWDLLRIVAPDGEDFLGRIQDPAAIRRCQDDIKELAKRLSN